GHPERAEARLARQRPGRFQQGGAHGIPAAAAAAVLGLLGPGRRLWTICLHPAAGVRTVRLWRTPVRPRFRSLAVRLGYLLRSAVRAALRHSHSTSDTYPDPALRLLRPPLAPPSFPRSRHLYQRGCSLLWRRATLGMAQCCNR